MPGVFISYRRDDSAGYAGRLFDILTAHFGRQNTYMDVDTIEGGDEFASVINQKIDTSGVLVAVIGPHWLAITDQSGQRRLDDPSDFVRLEIGKALERGIRVIPVLVGGAPLPVAGNLPDDLKPLAERQALEIRDTHFHPDAQQLIGVLQESLPGRSRLRRLAPALVCGALAVMAASGILYWERPREIASVQPAPPAAASVKPEAPLPMAEAAPGAKSEKSSASNSAKFAGKWTAEVKYDWGDVYQELFDFEVDDGEVSGMAGFLGDRAGAGRAIVDGKIQGNHIRFTTKTLSTAGSDGKTVEDKHYYKGALDGQQIRFTLVTDSSIQEHAPVKFIATRVKGK